MNDVLESFLHEFEYGPHPGAITPFTDLRGEFTRWLDDPELQLYWNQKRRLESSLKALGFPIGYLPQTLAGTFGATQGATLQVGNLGKKPARIPVPLVIEDGLLVPQIK